MISTQQLSLEIKEKGEILKRLAFKFTKDPEEINELVQDTFARSLRFFDRYFDNPKLIAWLYVIMRNSYINNYRRNQKKVLFAHHQALHYKNEDCSVTSSNNGSGYSFLSTDVKTVLQRYPPSYYQLFLNYTEGYKYRELAEKYGLPEGTVKTRIHHMRKQLQKQLHSYRYNR